MVNKVKRGRPAKIFTDTELREILGFVQNISFRTKAQQQLHEMNISCLSEHYRTLDMSDLTAELYDLLKIVNRQKNAYLKNIELYKIIQHKSTITIALTQLEKEILGYNTSDRDGFFNCQNALNTYNKLQKIAQAEIKRVESESRKKALDSTLKMQTEGQKRRKENERRKYWLGGVIQKYEKFLKESGVYSNNLSVEDVLDQLVKDAIQMHAIFSSNNYEQEVYLQEFDRLRDEIQNDKRR